MPTILIHTKVQAPLNRVFDLARSIDLHSVSVSHTREKAVSGRTSGLIELHETVTWQAVHFGIKQKLTSRITAMEIPVYFRDEMLRGAFRSIYHEHLFIKESSSVTLMTDKFTFESPWGLLGRTANMIFLKKYMHRFILSRNEVIKNYAETDKWKEILS